MTSIRIALAQMNATVGALSHNREKMLHLAQRGAEQGVTLMVFPELALCGYPPEDLILKRHFLEAAEQELEQLARELPPNLTALVGIPVQGMSRPRNAAAVLSEGKIAACYCKHHLPNYGVFDEQRLFEAGERPLILQIGSIRIGLHICEDSWVKEISHAGLLRRLKLDLLVNLSASPFHRGKFPERLEVLAATCRSLNTSLAYCNLVGGQDELVFDGGSLFLDPSGQELARAKRFEEDLLIQDLSPISTSTESEEELPRGVDWLVLDPESIPSAPPSLSPTPLAPPESELEEVYRALCLGLRDYTEKNGFKSILVAISGGIDSALVTVAAVDALGAERVHGISLPTRYSSDGTRSDAITLAENLGIDMPMVPIQELFDANLRLLSPLWPGRDVDVTEENLQARIRGTLVMTLSNKFGHLVVATGNKSEMATGYATLYGDMCGGYALIKDVPKTLVFRLCEWINAQAGTERIPQSLIDRPPSAELRENQQDSDSLPPYEELDRILSLYIEQDMGRDEIVAEGFDAHTVTRVIRLVDGNEYKRRQAPPGVKITPKAFGRDRRLPITNHFRPTSPTL